MLYIMSLLTQALERILVWLQANCPSVVYPILLVLRQEIYSKLAKISPNYHV